MVDFRINGTFRDVGGNSDSRLSVSFVAIRRSLLQKCVSLIVMFTIDVIPVINHIYE